MSNKIQKIRLSKGMTQTELAKRSKVSQSTISQIENGKRNPTVIVLMKIATALETPVSTFL